MSALHTCGVRFLTTNNLNMRLKFLLFFVVAALMAASCGEEFKYGGDNPDSLEIGANSLDFPASAAGATISVKSSGAWSASSEADWITAQKTADSLSVTATANPDIYSRSARVGVRSGNAEIFLEVVQAAMALDLDIQTTSLHLGCYASDSTVVVETNVVYEVKCPDWIKAEIEGDSLKISLQDNISLVSRSSDIYLCHGEEIVGSILVVQEPVIPEISFDRSLATGITVQSEASSDTIALSSNWPWSITAPSWLSIPLPQEAGEDGLVPAGDYVLTYTCTYSKYDRDSVIAFHTADKVYDMPFHQQGVPITLILSKTTHEAPFTKDTVKVTVTASDSWELAALPAWITSDISSGAEGDTEITLYIASNTSLDPRTAAVKVVCHTKTATLTITQKESGKSVSIVFADGSTAYRSVLTPSLGSSMANGYNLGEVTRALKADASYVLGFYSRGTTLTSTGTRGLRIKVIPGNYAHDKEIREENFAYIKLPAIEGMKISGVSLNMYMAYTDFYIGSAYGPTNAAAKASAVWDGTTLVKGVNNITLSNTMVNTPYYLLMFNDSVEYDFFSITVKYQGVE